MLPGARAMPVLYSIPCLSTPNPANPLHSCPGVGGVDKINHTKANAKSHEMSSGAADQEL